MGTYGLCLVCGFLLTGFCAYQKGKKWGLRIEDILIVGAMVLAGALLCGAGMYVLVTYSVSEILAFIQKGDFRFLTSGIVFYGGVIGGFVGALLGIRIAGTNILKVEHAVVPFVPLGHAIGRIGCVMAGCCHGFAYDGPLALYYPNSVAGLSPQQGYFPVQPLESVVNVGICLILLLAERRARKPMQVMITYLGLYAVARFGLEMLRGDTIRGQWNGLSTSQWVSLGLLAICCAYSLWQLFRKKNRCTV